MKLIFIRHGDPDYVHDSLTEKGIREAEYLAKRVAKWEGISEIYCSPLGRAQATASYSLKALNREAVTLDWLREFIHKVMHKEDGNYHVPWDFYPENWTKYSESYDKDAWTSNPLISDNKDIEIAAKEVEKGIDDILLKHGLTRHENGYYLSDDSKKDDTIVFFCHLGVSLLIIGHLLGISPFLLWHDVFVAPTSVTVLGLEERDKGKAAFRIQVMGDTRHLSDNNEPISASGYFTDCFQG